MGVITGWRIADSGSLLFVASFTLFHHWGWLEFEVRGCDHQQAFVCTSSLRAPSASGDRMFCRSSCQSGVSALLKKHLPDLLQISFAFKLLFWFLVFSMMLSPGTASISGSARSSQWDQCLQRCVEFKVLLGARLCWWAWLRRRDGDVRNGWHIQNPRQARKES